jgi:putative restriction endonuclease
MTKAVLTTKVEPAYDDLPEERYHFPRTYLRQVEAAIGDWIVYYEPRRTNSDVQSRGGRQAYFATARLQRIEPDPARGDHFYAIVSVGSYLDFDHSVPFREDGGTYEGGLTKSDGSTNRGAFGRAVRNLSDAEYDLILKAGFSATLGESGDGDRQRRSDNDAVRAAEDEPAMFERPVVERLVARPFRDAAFAAAVKAAYADTCAMTGLKIVNGGGRTEVQAAHIRPVAHRGPDSVRNGLALSGTIHWIFDRGLVSVDEDHRLLVAKDRLPDTVGRLLKPDMRLCVPGRLDLQPHPQFLRYHREQIFKG